MRFPRMTIRRWMAAIAVVASLVASAEMLSRRRSRFLIEAGDHKREVQEALDENMPLFGRQPSHWTRFRAGPPPPPPDPETSRKIEAWFRRRDARLVYHEAMYWKYTRAARYPWLPVERDPPAP